MRTAPRRNRNRRMIHMRKQKKLDSSAISFAFQGFS
jgi:hypothetical protein